MLNALCKRLGLAGLCVALWLMGMLQSAAAADVERVVLRSATPASLFDLARERRDRWAPIDIWGDLSMPAGAQAPVPAVVLSHGSDGVTPSLSQWVSLFNQLGVATLVVDSFGPRGVSSTAADQTSVPAAANVMDALTALQWLADDPRIDARRIGIMGFSRGGSVAYQTAQRPFLRAVVKSDRAFAFHIAAYAGCLQIYTSREVTQAPFLNLVGGADDYTHPEPCEALAAEYAALGTPVQSIRYEGAHHAWDSLLPMRWLPNATSGYACGVVRTDIPSWTVTSVSSGAVIPSADLGAFFKACVTRGVHVGRNAAALEASRRDVTRYVKEVLGRRTD